MAISRLLDQPGFSLGSIGSRHVLEDLRDMLWDKSEAGLEREIFVCTDLVEVFSTALRWNPERTDLFIDEKTWKAFKAFHAFKDALGKDPRDTFLRPLIQAIEKFLEGVATYNPRPFELPKNIKESVLKDLDRLIFLTEHGNFALPAK